MPAFGTPQAGSNPISGLNITDIRPGDPFVFLDGTESGMVSGYNSIPFARGMSGSGMDGGSTYVVSNCTTSQITLMVSNPRPADSTGVSPDMVSVAAFLASFQVANQFPAGNGAYTDQGRGAFYMAQVTTLGSGEHPVVTVQR